MKKKEIINKAWRELNFVPEETDADGFINIELLPDDFDIGNLDGKHSKFNRKVKRLTFVRPKSLKSKLIFRINLRRIYKCLLLKKPLE